MAVKAVAATQATGKKGKPESGALEGLEDKGRGDGKTVNGKTGSRVTGLGRLAGLSSQASGDAEVASSGSKTGATSNAGAAAGKARAAAKIGGEPSAGVKTGAAGDGKNARALVKSDKPAAVKVMGSGIGQAKGQAPASGKEAGKVEGAKAKGAVSVKDAASCKTAGGKTAGGKKSSGSAFAAAKGDASGNADDSGGAALQGISGSQGAAGEATALEQPAGNAATADSLNEARAISADGPNAVKEISSGLTRPEDMGGQAGGDGQGGRPGGLSGYLRTERQATCSVETRADISHRHRIEWEMFRETLTSIVQDPSGYEDKYIRNVKYVADTLRITQDGERRAFDYSAGATSDDTALQLSWDTGEEDGKD